MSRIIGLTGGIASGKSTVGAFLREEGATIVDADILAREVVEKGTPALSEIVQRFGDVLDEGGQLDRKKLGAIVFSDDNARRDLGNITHPRIFAASQAAFTKHVQAGIDPVIYEAALIVENGFHQALAATIVVSIPEEMQIQRLMKRDQISEEEAQRRLASQFPLHKKLEIADYVIDNSTSLEHTREQVQALWKSLQAAATS